MKLAISRWAVLNPTPVILLFVLAALAGLIGYFKLPITGNPKIELPIVAVSVSQPGASPRELEQNIALRLENALTGLTGVRHLTTSIADGSVELVAEFVLDADLNRAVADVRDAIARVRPELPQAIGEPVITRVDISGGPLLSYVLRAPTLSEIALTQLADDEARTLLMTVPGVQQVRRYGGSRRELRVELIADRLAELQLSVDDVLQQIRGNEQNLPAGRIRRGAQALQVRVISASINAAELASRPIHLRDGARIRLDAIAYIIEAGSESQGYTLLDGEPALILELYKSRGASELSLAKGVSEALAAYAKRRPELHFEMFYDGTEATRSAYVGARDTLIEGAVLTILVVLMFLRNWRATAIAAVAIPASLLPTFAAMHLAGFYLDSVSLLALILVIGILVDDAIVEVENIARRIELGESPYKAALLGADEIGLAVVAITAVIVAVFIPVSFIEGVVGKYFVEFGMTTSFAVIASLTVARLLTPLLCAHWLRPKKQQPANDARWLRRYTDALGILLEHPKLTAIGVVSVLLGSVFLLSLLPTGFLPKTRGNSLVVHYQLAPGSTAPVAVEKAEAMRSALLGIDDIAHVFAYDTGGGTGELRLVLRDKPLRRLTRDTLEARVRSAMGVQSDIRTSLIVADGGKEFRLDFESTDGAALELFVGQLHAEASQLNLLRDTETTRAGLQPIVDVRPRHGEIARLGVTAENLANTLRLATLGELDTLLPRIVSGDGQVPIRVRVAGGERLDIGRLQNLPVVTASGTLTLASVAEVALNSAPARIERLNRKRTLALTANLANATFSEAKAAIEALPSYRNRPASISLAQYGEVAYMDEMYRGFALAFLLGLSCVYAVLVLLFADWLQPLTIMAALPLSLGGAAAALLLTGQALNLSTLIGILMLFGIVAKNSILLVDFVVVTRAAGMDRRQALIQAGRERARPILMTTLAMIGGMLPAALGIGTDDGFRAPMAIAVIGGLFTSTLLSLLFVPVIYAWVDDLKRHFTRPRLKSQTLESV